MVWIPPGTFLRGDASGTADRSEVKTIQNESDEPCHEVHVDGYWIDRHLVTNHEYLEFLEAAREQGLARVEDVAVMGELEGSWVPFYYFRSFEALLPHHRRLHNARRPEFLHVLSWNGKELRIAPGKEEYPVVDVSWFGAAAYARFHGKELPTEAQWEKAARGPKDRRRFPWGDHVPGPYHAGMNSYRTRELSPVGRYSPLGDSPYGVADMLSGCFEWTNDWFHPFIYADYQAADAPLRNPAGPFWGRAHAIRGQPGGADYPGSSLLREEPVSFRYSWDFEFFLGDTFANRSTGFRTVVVPRE
ncbi:MAG: SUMF1/EgtB/PvdO family nonheme iron enzyme [Planctomycetes bacterium]|nr:SUMF1/EgtB/PvdO family nonheme iron enzyme [Planctomycetota bacterium]